MPILANPRHEKFAQLLAEGRSAYQSYIDAGFRASRANASRLKANDGISARVLEIQQAGAKSAEVSVTSLLDELEAARIKATSLGQLSAAVRCSVEKGRLAGLVVEKQEIAVTNVDPYAEMASAEKVLIKVVEDLGVRAAVALAAAFELPYDEAAIRAMCDTDGSPPGRSQQAIEDWRPPKVRRREL